MPTQSFSAYELARCASRIEMHDFGYESREELEEDLKENLIPDIEKDHFEIRLKSDGELCVNSQVNKSAYLYQNLLVRKMCTNVSKAYKVKQANRNIIIRQMKSLLKAPCELYVLRLDIHHFYDSIDGYELIKRIKADGKVNAQTIKYISRIFEIIQAEGITGLPKGVGISAVFSELFMKKFDYEIKRMDGVYFYARFVDDMVLFCNTQSIMDAVYQRIQDLLSTMHLSLNDKKTIKWIASSGCGLEYLGYKFTKEDISTTNVKVSIASSKINKVKTRIVRSFMAYMRDHNFDMLRKRMRYLTGNFSICVTDSPIKPGVGLYYNYKYIDNGSPALKELQQFYGAILHCRKGRLGSELGRNLTPIQNKELESYSFVFGYENRVHHAFSRSEIKQITRIW